VVAMKEKNGFIATSIMYSFFAVFAMLALIVLATYTHYRTLIDNINKNVLIDLNNNIAKKYTTIYNLLDNGEFENDDVWQYSNAARISKTDNYGSSYEGNYSVRFPNGNSSISQKFSVKDKVKADNKIHKIYFTYRIFRNGPVDGTGKITLNASGTNYYVHADALVGEFTNWIQYSEIFTVYSNSDDDWTLTFNLDNSTSSNYVYLDNILLTDITNVYNGNTTTNSDMKNYFDSYVKYFNGSYVLAKYGTGETITLTNNLSKDSLLYAGDIKNIEARKQPEFQELPASYFMGTTYYGENMYAMPDDYGKSYYYHGTVTNNNVIFGGFCWKVLRINGNGTTRMIYNGKAVDGECPATVSNDTSIGQSQYNPNRVYNNVSDNAYVGYMYGTPSSSTYDATHANTNSSTVKQMVDTWYAANLTSYTDKISDTEFCNDRSLFIGTGIGKTYTVYSGSKRLEAPDFICKNQHDRFTVADKTLGNGNLTYPVGLITDDEATTGIIFLRTNEKSWTMTPYDSNSGDQLIYSLESGSYCWGYSGTGNIFNVRPVINLNTNNQYTKGDGTYTTPYIID
jgi:hypothetical protein